MARGIAAIVFGVFALSRPGVTFLTLLMLLAVYAFVDGTANVIAAVRGGRAGEPRWGTLLVEGLLSIGLAVVAVRSPAQMAVALVWTMGFWALLTGALRIGAAIRLRAVIEHEWLLALTGVLGIGFGLLLLFRPIAGAMALFWWLGAYAIVFGIALTGLGLRLRHLAHGHESGSRGHGDLPTGGLHQPGA